MRRFSRRFVYVLIAALLLAQQGLALHGLSHGLEALKVAAKGQSDPRGQPVDRVCDLCLTYAQVAAGAAPSVIAFAAPSFLVSAPSQPSTDTGTTLARAYRSRAPPRTA